MATENLAVEIPEDLYTRFTETVTKKGGLWRNQESFTKALESAVAAALMLFLQGFDGGPVGLPEFRKYARMKYPELDEDLVTMFEDLIERRKEKKDSPPVTVEMAEEIGRLEIEKKHPDFFED